MRKKLNLFRLFTFSILFFICLVTVCHSAEKVVRTIEIKYPSKQITGSTAVVGVPGCKYTFKVVGTLPEGTHIEWKEQNTTKGSWSNNVLYPYAVGGGSGTYHIKAVLVGGEGPGPGWEVDVDGTITDPVLTYSEPGEDVYFGRNQTSPIPQVDLKVTVTKLGSTKLQGVTVLFIAKKSDNSIVNIGSSSSKGSGEATKIWNVPVSDAEVYTLKAGTGNDPNNLENETTGKKVHVTYLGWFVIEAERFAKTPKGYKIKVWKEELKDSYGNHWDASNGYAIVEYEWYNCWDGKYFGSGTRDNYRFRRTFAWGSQTAVRGHAYYDNEGIYSNIVTFYY